MAFRCRNCGGNVVFDIDTQMLKCQHCDSSFPAEEYQVRDYSSGSAGLGLTRFSCGGCGAELEGTEDSVVGFCPYCGGQSMLRIGSRPREAAEYVLPFQVSRARCAELYRENAKKVLYLPRELRDPEYLERFTGIYMPYYSYDVQIGQPDIQGTKTVEHHHRYDVVNTYQIDAQVLGGVCSVPFDASRYLDDEIAARAMPFDTRQQRRFHPAYLSGFYADASTVPANTYFEEAEAQASKDVVEEVAEQILAQEQIQVDTRKASVEARTLGYRSALLPMWFLTWRKGERVAYAVVNGESGKVVSDLPVDMRAFALGCAAAAVLVFALLELLVQPTPLLTSTVSLIAGALMMSYVSGGTRRIFEKETHANDKGWSAGAKQAGNRAAQDDPRKTRPAARGEQAKVRGGQDDPEKQADGKGKKSFRLPELKIHPALVVFLGIFAVYMILPGITASLPQLIAVAAPVYVILELMRVLRWQQSIPERQPGVAAVLLCAAVLLNAVVVFVSPVEDLWYYLGDALCILLLLVASVGMMQVYNLGTMRPLPKLFDRSEVS